MDRWRLVLPQVLQLWGLYCGSLCARFGNPISPIMMLALFVTQELPIFCLEIGYADL